MLLNDMMVEVLSSYLGFRIPMEDTMEGTVLHMGDPDVVFSAPFCLQPPT